MAAGYSGTPLATKLAIKSGSTLLVVNDPGHFDELVDPLPSDVVRRRRAIAGGIDVVVLFVGRRAELDRRIGVMGRAVFPNGGLWVAWPKRSSGIATDLTEDVVREVALPLGLVDNKVCAISEVWSGLRIVYRLVDR